MLTRRRLLQTTATLSAAGMSGATLSAAALLPGCGVEPADGSVERPYTREDPGQWTDKIEVHQPVVYAGLVDDAKVRVWIEVENADTLTAHEQSPAHYIKRIFVQDQDGAVLADAAYPPEAAARLITVLDLPATVTQLRVFEECNNHGVWLAVYDTAALKVAPLGDSRRPLTKDQPGAWAEKTATHVPILTKLDGGRVRIDVGDAAADKLHVTEAGHYIKDIAVYDQNAQELARVDVGAELLPTFELTVPAGVTHLRVVAWCNLHDHWEAELAL